MLCFLGFSLTKYMERLEEIKRSESRLLIRRVNQSSDPRTHSEMGSESAQGHARLVGVPVTSWETEFEHIPF